MAVGKAAVASLYMCTRLETVGCVLKRTHLETLDTKPNFLLRKRVKTHLQQCRISKISRGLYPRTPLEAEGRREIRLGGIVLQLRAGSGIRAV